MIDETDKIDGIDGTDAIDGTVRTDGIDGKIATDPTQSLPPGCPVGIEYTQLPFLDTFFPRRISP